MNINDLRAASKSAAGKTNQELAEEIANLADSKFEEALMEMAQSGISAEDLDQLTQEVNQGTSRNQAILNIMDKSETIASIVKDVVQKYI